MTHGASTHRGWTGRLSCLQALLCACALVLAACPPTDPPEPEGDDDDVSGDDDDVTADDDDATADDDDATADDDDAAADDDDSAPAPVELCGNGLLELYEGTPTPCTVADELEIETLAELTAWAASPDSDAVLTEAVSAAGAELSIETECSFRSLSGADLTELGSLFFAAQSFDLRGDVSASGSVLLRAASEARSRAPVQFTASALEIEAPVVDQRGDAAVSDRLCLEGGEVFLRMNASHEVSGAEVLLVGAELDVRADFSGATELSYLATGDLEARQPSRLESIGVVQLEAGGSLDVHGDFSEIDELTLVGEELTCRSASTTDASGLVSVTATELVLNCNIVGNDDVAIVSGSYTTSTGTDLSGNTACTLSGVHDGGPVPSDCAVLP